MQNDFQVDRWCGQYPAGLPAGAGRPIYSRGMNKKSAISSALSRRRGHPKCAKRVPNVGVMTAGARSNTAVAGTFEAQH
jgi:hypothetical protein